MLIEALDLVGGRGPVGAPVGQCGDAGGVQGAGDVPGRVVVRLRGKNIRVVQFVPRDATVPSLALGALDAARVGPPISGGVHPDVTVDEPSVFWVGRLAGKFTGVIQGAENV